MHYFDIVALKDTAGLDALAKRLGYKKIFSAGSDFTLASEAKGIDPNCKAIVRSKNGEMLLRAIRENAVVGVVIEDVKPSGKFLEGLRSHEKVLVIPAAPLMCPDLESRARSLHRAKELLRSAIMSRVDVALATLAADRACMASSAQMLEIAGLIGANVTAAKAMLSAMGRLI